MPYTRRDLIRDAALIAATGAAAGLPFAFPKKPGNHSTPTLTPPKQFDSGVRIFFCGSWLFCADPKNKGYMWAICRDMSTMAHNFPYGAWDSNKGIDGNGTSLPCNTGGGLYAVSVTGFQSLSAKPSVDDLFGAASKEGLSYFPNSDGDLAINQRAGNLRIISVPIPTKMTLAAYLPGAYINHNDNAPINTPNSISTLGIPTAHIFEYIQDSTSSAPASLTFQPPPGSIVGSPKGQPQQISLTAGLTYASDLHFHTIPCTSTNDPTHAPRMFTNLMNVVSSKSAAFGSGDLALVPSTSDPNRGPYVPCSVDKYELEIKEVATKLGNVASCAGGAVGVGGDVGS